MSLYVVVVKNLNVLRCNIRMEHIIQSSAVPESNSFFFFQTENFKKKIKLIQTIKNTQKVNRTVFSQTKPYRILILEASSSLKSRTI